MAWVGDITYVATHQGWLYLAVVISVQTQQVLGYSVSERMTEELVVKAFVNARALHPQRPSLIFHSDRGAQDGFTGPHNTFNLEVFMGRPAGWMKQLTGRDAMRSPWALSLRREVERQFWVQIATGITSEKAADAVSQAVGSRWFRHPRPVAQ